MFSSFLPSSLIGDKKETLFIAEQNLLCKCQIRSSFDKNILASATDQLTTACRASLCIAAPMVQMSEECIAVMASGRFRPPFVEVPGSTHLDAVVTDGFYISEVTENKHEKCGKAVVFYCAAQSYMIQ